MSFAMRALKAVCPPDHTYKVALYPDAISLDAYTPKGEWVGRGYAAGGNVLTGYRAVMDGQEAVLRFNNTEWLDVDGINAIIKPIEAELTGEVKK